MNEYVKSDLVRYGARPTFWGGCSVSIFKIEHFAGKWRLDW